MLKLKIVLLALLYSICANSQKVIPIEIDRPDQTECSAIVPKGMFQMENGFNFENADEAKSFLLPTSLWKFGLSSNFELRLITDFLIENSEENKTIGLKPIYVGFKLKICDEEGIVPKTSIIAHVLLPKIASAELKNNYFAPKFRFTMQHTLTEKSSLSYNLGTEWDGETAQATAIYTITNGYKLSEKWGVYIELYGFISQFEKADHRYDGGFTYLLNDDVILDVSGGSRITNNAPILYVSFGFSFRI